MPGDTTIEITIDPSLLEHVTEELARKKYRFQPEEAITFLVSSILDHSPYPIRAKRTASCFALPWRAAGVSETNRERRRHARSMERLHRLSRETAASRRDAGQTRRRPQAGRGSSRPVSARAHPPEREDFGPARSAGDASVMNATTLATAARQSVPPLCVDSIGMTIRQAAMYILHFARNSRTSPELAAALFCAHRQR
jgi:hypothetical protein